MPLTTWRSPVSKFLALLLLFCLVPSAEGAAWNLWKGNDLLGAVEIRDAGGLRLVALSDVAKLAALPFREEKESVYLSGSKGELECVKNASVARFNAQIIPLASSITAAEDLWWIEASTMIRLLNLLEGLPPARGFRWAGEGKAEPRTRLTTPSVPGMAPLPEPPVAEKATDVSDQPEPDEGEPKTELDRRLKEMVAALEPGRTQSPSGETFTGHGVRALRWGDQGGAIRAVFDLDGAQDPKVFLKPGKTTLVFRGASPGDLDRHCPDGAMALSVTDHGGSVSFAFDHPSWEVKHFFLPSPPRYVVDFLVGTEASEPVPSPDPMPAPPPSSPRPAPAKGAKPLVVLDPGHGGKDPGAVAFGLREKDLNLQIALKMEKELQRLGADVRLTRRDDRYLKLAERTELANNWGADIFVSVHINALPAGRHATGIEIYLMALPTDKDAMQLALIENAELDGNGGGGGADKRTNLLLKILGDMQQNAKISESTGLAEAMFQRGKAAKLSMRRVAQAPFYVLRGAAMPAVLLELGFITERSEARLLADSSYQQRLAAALAPGILDYIKKAP